MPLIRPAVSARLWHLREVIATAATAAVGLWLIWLGGYILFPLGTLILAFAASWALTALRRLRFAQTVNAPGVVEVDEAQIGYLGPGFGGYVALPDLVELRLVAMYGRRLWRLKQADGQAVLIPIDAAGADRLFDAFASLPGMDSAALVAALDLPAAAGQGGLPTLRSDASPPTAAFHVVWRRQAAIAPASSPPEDQKKTQ